MWNLSPAYNVSSVVYPSISVAINSVKEVPIFPNYDPEAGSVTVFTADDSTNPVKSVIASDFSKISFYPLAFTEVGAHNITIYLQD